MSHTKDGALKPWFPVYTETVKQSFPDSIFSELKIWIKSQTATKTLCFFKKTKQKTPTYVCTVPGDAHTTCGCRRSCLFQVRCPEDAAHGRWPLIRHHEAGLSVPYRIGISGRRADSPPVSRSICCTSARPRRCARRTCVSWVTLKLIWGLRGSDSWPDEAWRKPRPMPWENALIRPYHTSFTAPYMLGRRTYASRSFVFRRLPATWALACNMGKTKPKILLELYRHENRVSIQF